MAKTGNELLSDLEPSEDGAHGVQNAAEDGSKYTVVARRYRPKTFEELVGQDTVAHALMRAIETHRVGHAYLFTGARGVGKTSTARIFAKALNASQHSDGKFDPSSEIALAIDSGEDMDVIEIDGASNRGIDEIRQLRANASIRPTRSHFKIYIIDEVHMLTTQAFNALLKTLEEPPAHVKFIFCTTDPEKIPITVLSRCQRFDFPPVHSDQILGRLRFICQTEGVEADEAALRLIARRAAGSMRDSQSLLEQLLSFGGNRISVDEVHAMLGTADETRLAAFATKLIQRDAAGALVELDAAVAAGVDSGQLAEQLLGYLRDMMAVTVGGSAELMRTANPNSVDALRESGKEWGVMTLLSALQLLDETIVRMKHSVQSRILLEVALVQICNLQNLQSLAEVVKAFSQQQAPAVNARPAGVPGGSTGLNRPAVTAASTSNASSMRSPASNAEELKKKAELGVGVASQEQALASMSNPAPAPSSVQASSTTTNAVASRSLRSDETQNELRTPSEPDRQVAQAGSSGVNRDEAVVSKAAVSNVDMDEVNRILVEETATAGAVEGVDASENSSSVKAVAEAAQDRARDEAASSTTADQSNQETKLEILHYAASKLEGLVKQCAAMAVDVVEVNANQWKVKLSRDGGFALGFFRAPENTRKLLQAIDERIGRQIALEFELTEIPSSAAPVVMVNQGAAPANNIPQNQRIRNAMADPLVKRFIEVFEGQVVRVDPPIAQVPRPAVTESVASASNQ